MAKVKQKTGKSQILLMLAGLVGLGISGFIVSNDTLKSQLTSGNNFSGILANLGYQNKQEKESMSMEKTKEQSKTKQGNLDPQTIARMYEYEPVSKNENDENGKKSKSSGSGGGGNSLVLQQKIISTPNALSPNFRGGQYNSSNNFGSLQIKVNYDLVPGANSFSNQQAFSQNTNTLNFYVLDRGGKSGAIFPQQQQINQFQYNSNFNR